MSTTEITEMTFANLELKCYVCGKPGHTSKQCRHKDKIPRTEWAINQTARNENLQMHAQTMKNASSDTAMSTPKASESKKSGSGNSNGDTGWFFAQVQVE